MVSADDDILAAIARTQWPAWPTPLMDVELFSLTGHGRLRPFYAEVPKDVGNIYFVGNGCDPSRSQTWRLIRVEDGSVGLFRDEQSPAMYALGSYTLEPKGFRIVRFRYRTGPTYLGVATDPGVGKNSVWPQYPVSHVPAQESDPRPILWFLAIQRTYSPLPAPGTLTVDDIRRDYAKAGLSASEEEVSRLAAQIGASG